MVNNKFKPSDFEKLITCGENPWQAPKAFTCVDYVKKVDCYASKFGEYLDYDQRVMFFMLSLMSMLCLLFVAFTILNDSRLQSHPQPMIAYICLIEAGLIWSAFMQHCDPSFMACYFGVDDILAYLLAFPFQIEFASQKDTVNSICWANQILLKVAQVTSLVLNSCLCLDIVFQI